MRWVASRFRLGCLTARCHVFVTVACELSSFTGRIGVDCGHLDAAFHPVAREEFVMARLRQSAGSLLGFAAGVWIVMGMASAQQPPPVPSTPPVAGSTIPPPSDVPQPVPPAVGSGSTGPQVTSGPGPGLPGGTQPASMPVPQRFTFKIDPKTPTTDLLPTPPVVKRSTSPVLTDDLAKIAEVEFQARPEKITTDGKLTEQIAHQLAKINHLNARKTDAFMIALLANRADLAGLPFAMGESCRTTGERTRQFTIAVNTVRQALGGNRFVLSNRLNADMSAPSAGPQGSSGGAPPAQQSGFLAPPPLPSGNFWTQYPTLCEQQDAVSSRADAALREHVTVARIAALMQMLAAESAGDAAGAGQVPHRRSARRGDQGAGPLAIFSPKRTSAPAAIDVAQGPPREGLHRRPGEGPALPVAGGGQARGGRHRQLERTDLIPELVAVLAQDRPAAAGHPGERREEGFAWSARW